MHNDATMNEVARLAHFVMLLRAVTPSLLRSGAPAWCLRLAWWMMFAAAAPLVAPAAIYDLARPGDGDRALRLNLPDAPARLRGLLIFGNGASGDSRSMATDPELAALAESLGFAVLATARWGYFADGTVAGGELARFESALGELAATSGHAELTRVPWLPIGHSNGGQMSYGFNALRPEKTIAMVVSKGGFYLTARPANAALATPALLIAGEADLGYRVTAIRDLFFGNRPRGALWAWVEDEGVDHALAGSNDLTLPFVEAMAWARLPPGANAADGSAPLRPLDEATGWLTDPETYKGGFAEIADFATYAKPPSAAGWLPDRRLAYLFRGFASYHKAGTATLTPYTATLAWGASVTYTVGWLPAGWTAIAFYDGDRLLKQILPTQNAPLAVTLTPAKTGYTVLHAVVTFDDGRQRTTPPRRVFVLPPALALTVVQPAPVATVAAGTEVSLTVSAASPHLTYAWYRDGERLPDWSGASVTLVAGAADAGHYTVTASDVQGRSTTVSLGVLQVQPSARLMNLSARGRVGLGDDVLIAGFVATADDDNARKSVLIRGIGPELARSLGVPGALRATELRWFDATGARVALAGDWNSALASVFARIGAFPLAAGSHDAAWLRSTGRGAYSAHVAAADSRPGIGLVEIYDADEASPPGSCRLANLSARANVGPGDDLLIGGFVVAGSTSATIMVRAVGPALGRPPFGMTGVLAAPLLDIFDAQGRPVASNQGWPHPPQRLNSPVRCGLSRATATLMAKLGASALAEGSADSALVLTLPPGAYSAHVSGADGGTGIGMVEIYLVE